jgi:hypothetical protein
MYALKWSSVNRTQIMFNHSHTVLLITRQVLARIDLSGKKKRLSVKQIWSAPSGDYDAIMPEVSRTIKLATRRPNRVTIVCPDFWTDLLSIPADVAAIASGNEINQALALEAEVDSGLSAFDSRTSALRIIDPNSHNEDCQWCVSQVPSAQIQELSKTLQTSGIKLHSIAHPIAGQLTASARDSVESVRGLLDKWRDQTSLGAEELQTLANTWAACLSQTPQHPMLMLGESDVALNSQPIVLTASLALLAAGGCGLWHWQSQQSLTLTTQAIERLEKQQSQYEATEAALKIAEASVLKSRQEVNKSQSIRQATERQLQLAGAVHSQHNQRWLALVDALAESATENCWVQKLESDSVRTIVHGLALDNAAANGFAGRLELALKGSGWRTAPAATSVSSHNLIAFKIVLKATQKPDEPTENSKISLNRVLSAASNKIAGVTQP